METAPEQVDVEALLERLREELRWGVDGSLRARARTAAEQFWPVSAERPVESRNAVDAFAKRVLRKLMRWYVEPLAQQQRSFNDAALKLIDELFEEVDRLAAERQTAGRLLQELEERLRRAERRGGGGAAAAVGMGGDATGGAGRLQRRNEVGWARRRRLPPRRPRPTPPNEAAHPRPGCLSAGAYRSVPHGT